MQLRSSIALCALFLSAFAAAQGARTAQIQVDNAKHLQIFVRDGLPTDDLSSDVQLTDGATASVDIPDTGVLYVWNTETGNMASKPVTQVGKSWHIASKEFTRIGLVSVRVEYVGEAVASARVVLKDKSREQSQTLDKDANGEVQFYVVQPGPVTVTVEYRSAGSQAPPLVQQFDLKLQRKTPSPLLKVALPNPVETVARPVPNEETQTRVEEQPKPRLTNPIGSALVFLFTVGIAVLLAWGLYTLAKKNPDWLKSKLSQAGVDVPDAPQHVDADTKIPDLEPVKPKAQSKIMLDDAGLPPAPAAPVPGQLVNHEPRLVKGNGEFVNLIEGETVVGREENLGLSLVGESSVSRRHASITRQGLYLTVKDLGSTNGTFVNGRRIQDEAKLSPGDDVQFGAVKFRVEGR